MNEGISFGDKLYPDFSPFAVLSVEIEMGGDRFANFREANRVSGIGKTPKGYVWHEAEDGMTMQLIPKAIHSPENGGPSHRGGIANIKAKK
jgi:hypothetical protein